MKSALLAIALMTGSAALAQSTDIVAPANSNPETDARGIPVISAPAEVPPGANQPVRPTPGVQATPAPNQQQVFAPRPAQTEYPPCTREVTDNCVQTYERGVRRPR
ncbi:MAG: hypothetical protein M3N07_04525 [Pseudomonadota bacterium]|nr:hypothetical protein [Pseudomonadota bacterium]